MARRLGARVEGAGDDEGLEEVRSLVARRLRVGRRAGIVVDGGEELEEREEEDGLWRRGGGFRSDGPEGWLPGRLVGGDGANGRVAFTRRSEGPLLLLLDPRYCRTVRRGRGVKWSKGSWLAQWEKAFMLWVGSKGEEVDTRDKEGNAGRDERVGRRGW